MDITTDKLSDLDDLEAYLETFVGRCGIASVNYGNWQDIVAALNRGIVTPCMWWETAQERGKWNSGRTLEAEFRLLVLEGKVETPDDTKGMRALHRAAKKRLLPHKHRTEAGQRDTILYQLIQDSANMEFDVTIPEPLDVQTKDASGQDLLVGVYLDKVYISILSPFQDNYKTHSSDF